MNEFEWTEDIDVLDSFIEGEYYSTGRWSMNSMTGYKYCGRSKSKADYNVGEEQLLFLTNLYPPCDNYPEGRPSYFALSISYIEEHMIKTNTTMDDLKQFTDKRDKSKFHN